MIVGGCNFRASRVATTFITAFKHQLSLRKASDLIDLSEHHLSPMAVQDRLSESFLGRCSSRDYGQTSHAGDPAVPSTNSALAQSRLV